MNEVTGGKNAALPPRAPYQNEGRTRAAWTLMCIVILGAAVIAVAMIIALTWLIWVGVGIVVLGLIIGKIMSAVGLGQTRIPVGPDIPLGPE